MGAGPAAGKENAQFDPGLLMDKPVILLTGFDPFGGETVNPSWLLAQALHGESLDGARIVARRLPCEFGAARTQLLQAMEELGSALVLVLALGQASGRVELSLERVAINIDDARIADNAGAQPVDQAVVAGGPAAYFSSLPIKAMVAALREAGLPAGVSQTAGTFVCNHVFYGLQHALAGQRQVRGGFMHIPLLPEQAASKAGLPSMSLATMVQGLRLALRVALRTQADLLQTGGALS